MGFGRLAVIDRTGGEKTPSQTIEQPTGFRLACSFGPIHYRSSGKQKDARGPFVMDLQGQEGKRLLFLVSMWNGDVVVTLSQHPFDQPRTF
jgi:hypothetical protein